MIKLSFIWDIPFRFQADKTGWVGARLEFQFEVVGSNGTVLRQEDKIP